MSNRNQKADTTIWFGGDPGGGDSFDTGGLWVGKHAADQDILVLDPAESDPAAEMLSLYSLSQHRLRRFPRSLVLEKIPALTDELAQARAKKDYAQRSALRDAHQTAMEAARTERMDQVRETMIAAHQRHVENLGLDYQGVQKTVAESRSGRTVKCHVCEHPLDDFVGVTCGICSGVLCSCGACTCGKPTLRGRRAAKAEAESEA
jgi:hypothetical protein